MPDQRAAATSFLNQQIELILQTYFVISIGDALNALALQEEALHIF